MKTLVAIAIVAALLLIGNALLDNTSQPIQAEAPRIAAPIVETSPSDKCCGDACDCCDRCPCNVSPESAVEVVAEVVKPAPKQTPAAYSVGDDIVTQSGQTHTVTRVSVINGRWAYHTAPKDVSVNVSTPTSYAPRWANYDGLSREDHARVYHGIDPSGMSQTQLYQQLDADHDKFGAGHSQIMQTRKQPVQSSCPGGVCPAPRRTLFRW